MVIPDPYDANQNMIFMVILLVKDTPVCTEEVLIVEQNKRLIKNPRIQRFLEHLNNLIHEFTIAKACLVFSPVPGVSLSTVFLTVPNAHNLLFEQA